METVRTCRKCGQTKPMDEFPLAQNGLGARYRRRECKACYADKMREYSREYQRAHKPKSFNKRAYFARVLAGLKLER